MSNKGFTLIEVLIATSIIVVMVTSIVPIATLLNYEREILSDRRTITYLLHDELQPFIWEEDGKLFPVIYTKSIKNKIVTLRFTLQNEFIKGCAKWENVKQSNETVCLFGYPEE